jgi:predicted  nucleic acid-binding Zn-ribbon protein
MAEPMLPTQALALAEEAIVALERECQRIPQAIAEQEGKLAASREAVATGKRNVEEADKRRRARESELEDANVKRAKLQAQSALVKTNQEYTAMLSEIEGVTRRMGELEDEILEAMEQADTARAELQLVEQDQGQVEREIGRAIEELRARLAVAERELALRRTDEAQHLSQISPDARAIYSRVKRVRGTGTARVRGRSCAGCNRDVPYELVNRIRAGEIHPCSNCNRILVVVPEPEAARPTG